MRCRAPPRPEPKFFPCPKSANRCIFGSKGKVVLIDGWATSCPPCMTKMPELRELYRRYQAEGFEIIGINFDQALENARQAIAEHELKWPQVYVPSDDRTRELWYKASSLANLPRLILLDREGVVRADIQPDELGGELKKLLPTEKP
jgi:thiol-disulfide isomerase/thioredoxin